MAVKNYGGEFWNERVRGLAPYTPGEQPRNRRYVKLNTNENPYPPSPLVIEAIKQAADDRLRLYPDPECWELRESIAERFGVQPEQVFAGNGSDEILAFAFGAFFSDKVLFPDVTYSFYPVYAKLWGVPFECPPLNDDFSINPDDYTRGRLHAGVVFPNPNAPTGRSMEVSTILSIAAARKDRVVIVDEAYAAFAQENLSVASYAAADANLLTVHTLSKFASLAGLRVGFAIGNESLIEGLRRMRDSFNSYTLDRLAQAGAIAVMKDRAYDEGVTRKVIDTRERVSAALSSMGFEVIPSDANFVFIRHPAQKGADFFAYLREKSILTRHFNNPPRITDFLRVSIGTDSDMDMFLEACQESR
ncbi:MAG: histidinol-phosphate transaminase [Treponema sp.]|jgi:histidinol-phosphate aminotransferase|nr:histidinol-phosphate transaminase [Treponema sp.]